jgi:hypothetical protein
MATAAENFNRMMAGHSNARMTAPTYRPTPQFRTGNRRRELNARSGVGVSSGTQRRARVAAGLSTGGGGGHGSSGSPQIDAYQNIYNQLASKYIQTQNEQQAITAAQGERNQNQDHERNWLGDVWNAVGGGMGLIDNGTGFAGSIVGRGLDLAMRPFYALNEGMQSLAELPEEHQGWSNIGDQLSTFAGGLERGITGEDKTGFGQVYEAIKNNPTDVIGQQLSRLEDWSPTTESWLSRAVGLGGELAIDPYRVVGPGFVNTIRSGVNEGSIATEDVLRNTVADIGERGARDIIANPALADTHVWQTARGTAGSDMLIQRMRDGVTDAFDAGVVTARGGGRPGVRLMNSRMWPTVVADRVRTAAKAALGESLRNDIDSLWHYTFGSTVRARRSFGIYVQRLINKSDNFKEFWTSLTDDLVKKGRITATHSIDDVLDEIALGSVDRKFLDGLGDNVLTRYDAELDAIHNHALADAHNPVQRNLGVKLPGGREIPVRLTGRAFSRLGTGLNKVMPNLTDILDRNIFERHFPGIFSGKLTKYRALGFRDFETFRDEIKDMARNYSRDETRQISKMLRTGGNFADPRLQAGLDFARDKYLQIFTEEYGVGARADKDIHQALYEYVHLKGGSKADRIAFNEGRAKAWRTQGNPGRWTVDLAKDMGLKPQENAFENLTLRLAASRRNIVQALFKTDLVENWASEIPKLDSHYQSLWKLKKLSIDELPLSYRQMMKDGKRFYLPESIWKMADTFEKISNWNTNEWYGIARGASKIINLVKASVTLPFFGFHFKNMVGDIFMGLLDDIHFGDYRRVIDKYQASLRGASAVFTIVPGQLEYDFDRIVKFFLEDADAGFFHVDSGLQQSATAGSLPRRIGRHVTSTLAEASDIRERIPRFVHYETAFEQEAKALWDGGMRDITKIEQKARDAALMRVNGYKFDYNALMPWEQNLKAAAFPFYTYMRKAAPLLLEQMLINPYYFGLVNRFMTYNDGTGADDFNAMNMPSWIRNLGFAEVNHGEGQPWELTSDVLPLGSLELLTGSHNAQELAGNVLQNLNPLAKAPLEMWAGRNTYTGQPTGNGWDYLMQNLPLLGDVQQLFSDPPSSGQDFLTRRLTGLGLPFHHVTYQQQEQQQAANRDQLIDNPIKRFNYSSDMVHISVTDDMHYRVTLTSDPSTPIAIFSTPQAAINYARSLPNSGFQQGYVDPYHPPTQTDVQTAMGGR